MANVWTNLAVALCSEVDQSSSENFDSTTGFTASVQLRCLWADRLTLLDDIVGNLRSYPKMPTAGARARSGSCVPDGGKITAYGAELELGSYEHALLTINYLQGADKDPGSEDIISESLEPSAEFLTLDYRQFRWGSADGDKLEPEQAPGKLIIGFDYVQTRYNLNSLPAAILNPGICNQNAFFAKLLGLTFPPQTLLYQNSQPSRTIRSDGESKWTMTSRASCRPHGWNKFWREKTQAYESIYIADGAEYKNFPTGNLGSVFV